MAEKTTVVNLRSEKYDVYIGRAVSRWGLKASPWGNPYTEAKYGREQCILLFKHWLFASESPKAIWIREHVHELRGKRLGCWCAPLPCHGSILAGMADREAERETTR